MKKISIIVNIYIDTDSTKENPFDHPTNLEKFEEQNTFVKFNESICRLRVPENCEYDLIVFAIAANDDCSKDNEIKAKIGAIVNTANFNVFVVTNSDIRKLQETGMKFLSADGYCEIRNLGFVFGYYNGADYLIQFDDDEIIPENYLVKMIKIFNENLEICNLNSLYEKDGKVTVDDSSDFKCWPKLAYMNQDFERLSRTEKPVESIFGLGGNMAFKKEFYSKICYPESVRRGEDFALLMAARLIYENGNDICGIEKNRKEFTSWFTSEKDMIIAHRPPKGHNKLHKLKNDFIRFVKQRAFLGKNLSEDKLKELSRYMYGMLIVEGYIGLVEKVYKEAAEKEPEIYSSEFIKSEIKDIKKLFEDLRTKNLFEEYKKFQFEYINFLEKNSIEILNYLI